MLTFYQYLTNSQQFILISNMLTISDTAAARLLKMQSEQATPEHRLRVFVDAGGCSGFEYGMSFDLQKDGDQLLEHNGVEYLMDTTSLEYLNGSVVEFDDGLTGKGFSITNPNATSTCGCGRSFN